MQARRDDGLECRRIPIKVEARWFVANSTRHQEMILRLGIVAEGDVVLSIKNHGQFRRGQVGERDVTRLPSHWHHWQINAGEALLNVASRRRW